VGSQTVGEIFLGKKRVLAIGDTHYPFHCKKSLGKLYDHIQDEVHGPIDMIIQLGDLYDLWSFSRWPKAQNQIKMTPADELAEARECAERMWEILNEISPKSKKVQLKGNHDIRLATKLEANLPELMDFISLDHLWKFPKVKTIQDVRQEFIYNGVCYIHGFRSKFGDHAKYNMMPTVCGHSHVGGVISVMGALWEANAGFLGDAKAKALSYTRQKWARWTRGYLIIDEFGPRFINLEDKWKK